jgi:two-component SAPR family response regulator
LGRLLSDVFDVFPAGIVVASADGRVLTWNPAAAALLGEEIEAGVACCQVFGCGPPGTSVAHGCLTELAATRGARPLEFIVEPPARPGTRVAVMVSPLNGSSGGAMLFEVRVATASAEHVGVRPTPDTIRIRSLGESVVETAAGEIRADWLDQRAGRLLKFLVAHRYTPVHADAIAEALWPRARTDTTTTVRHFVHALRDKLEPGRGRYGSSLFVLARNGGYLLNPERVSVDADDFERDARAGMIGLAAHDDDALERLRTALRVYRGDFLADERFEDWAIIERERLRDIATQTLRALATETDDDAEAAVYLERLADMEPLDVDVNRDLIRVWLRQGRRGRAIRHYRTLQSRLIREFGERVNFDLSELAGL